MFGRVGIYKNTDNTTGLSIVPDSHVTVIRSFSCISSHYLYAFMKAHQSELEKEGEGSTNQKELKPLTLKEMLIAVPPLSEQEHICKRWMFFIKNKNGEVLIVTLRRKPNRFELNAWLGLLYYFMQFHCIYTLKCSFQSAGRFIAARLTTPLLL